MLISTSNWFKLQPKQLVRFLFFDFLGFTFALKHLLSAKLAWQKHGALSCPFSRQVHHPLQIVMPKWFIDVFCLLAWFFPPAFWLRVFFLWRGTNSRREKHREGEHPVTIWLFYVWLQGLITWNLGLQHWAPWVKNITLHYKLHYILYIYLLLLLAGHFHIAFHMGSPDAVLWLRFGRFGSSGLWGTTWQWFITAAGFQLSTVFLHNLCQMIGTYKWYVY